MDLDSTPPLRAPTIFSEMCSLGMYYVNLAIIEPYAQPFRAIDPDAVTALKNSMRSIGYQETNGRMILNAVCDDSLDLHTVNSKGLKDVNGNIINDSVCPNAILEAQKRARLFIVDGNHRFKALKRHMSELGREENDLLIRVDLYRNLSKKSIACLTIRFNPNTYPSCPMSLADNLHMLEVTLGGLKGEKRHKIEKAINSYPTDHPVRILNDSCLIRLWKKVPKDNWKLFDQPDKYPLLRMEDVRAKASSSFFTLPPSLARTCSEEIQNYLHRHKVSRSNIRQLLSSLYHKFKNMGDTWNRANIVSHIHSNNAGVGVLAEVQNSSSCKSVGNIVSVSKGRTAKPLNAKETFSDDSRCASRTDRCLSKNNEESMLPFVLNPLNFNSAPFEAELVVRNELSTKTPVPSHELQVRPIKQGDVSQTNTYIAATTLASLSVGVRQSISGEEVHKMGLKSNRSRRSRRNVVNLIKETPTDDTKNNKGSKSTSNATQCATGEGASCSKPAKKDTRDFFTMPRTRSASIQSHGSVNGRSSCKRSRRASSEASLACSQNEVTRCLPKRRSRRPPPRLIEALSQSESEASEKQRKKYKMGRKGVPQQNVVRKVAVKRERFLSGKFDPYFIASDYLENCEPRFFVHISSKARLEGLGSLVDPLCPERGYTICVTAVGGDTPEVRSWNGVLAAVREAARALRNDGLLVVVILEVDTKAMSELFQVSEEMNLKPFKSPLIAKSKSSSASVCFLLFSPDPSSPRFKALKTHVEGDPENLERNGKLILKNTAETSKWKAVTVGIQYLMSQFGLYETAERRFSEVLDMSGTREVSTAAVAIQFNLHAIVVQAGEIPMVKAMEDFDASAAWGRIKIPTLSLGPRPSLVPAPILDIPDNFRVVHDPEWGMHGTTKVEAERFGVIDKPSEVPLTGRGLFTTRSRVENEVVCYFWGEVISADIRWGKYYYHDSIIDMTWLQHAGVVKKPIYLKASRHSLARYANGYTGITQRVNVYMASEFSHRTNLSKLLAMIARGKDPLESLKSFLSNPRNLVSLRAAYSLELEMDDNGGYSPIELFNHYGSSYQHDGTHER